MTRNQGLDAIVWNDLGQECQRLNLYHQYVINSQLANTPISHYHMNSYSFSSDSMFISSASTQFFVITHNKRDSFIGQLMNPEYKALFNAHFMMGNSSEGVWLLGGGDVMRGGSFASSNTLKEALVTYSISFSMETKIANLKYIKTLSHNLIGV